MTITLTHLLLLCLAAYRLAILLAYEDGPGDCLERLRLRLGARYDEYSQPYGTTILSKAALCPHCSSVWIGAFFTIGYAFFPAIALWLALPLAVSAGAVLITEALDG